MRLTALAALTVALSAAPAQAQTPWSIDNQHPGSDLPAAVGYGTGWWQRHTGRTPPCPPQFTWVDAPLPGAHPDAYASTYPNSCAGFLYRNNLAAVTWQRFCTTIMHEVGHMVGFVHGDPEFIRFETMRPTLTCSTIKGGWLRGRWLFGQRQRAERLRQLVLAPKVR